VFVGRADSYAYRGADANGDRSFSDGHAYTRATANSNTYARCDADADGYANAVPHADGVIGRRRILP
jgi:hypothetical protein